MNTSQLLCAVVLVLLLVALVLGVRDMLRQGKTDCVGWLVLLFSGLQLCAIGALVVTTSGIAWVWTLPWSALMLGGMGCVTYSAEQLKKLKKLRVSAISNGSDS